MTEARTETDYQDDLPPIEDDLELDGAPGTAGPPHAGRTDTPDVHHAAGVVLVKGGPVGPRVAVLEAGGVVSLPKAEVGPGMSAETAAMEAAVCFIGRRVRLVESIGEVEEILDGERVRCWFWLATPALARGRGGLGQGDSRGPAAHGFALHWVDLEEAAELLTSGEERAIVDRLRHRQLPVGRTPLANPDGVALADELQALRDESLAGLRGAEDPERTDALLRMREEIERAEERLDRGDRSGARRARVRAEREALAALDADGRALAFRRTLDRAPDHLRHALGATLPADGSPVSLDVLLAVHSAVEHAMDEEERARAVRRAAQTHVTLALAATIAALLAAATFGLFETAPRPVLQTSVAALIFVASGALGGWVGEALHALRTRADGGRSMAVSLPMAAAAGGLAGLALGAFLTGGLQAEVLDGAALKMAATFTAGWLVRTILPR